MTVRMLKELLACMPDDVLDTPLGIDRNGLFEPAGMLLIDPPNNYLGVDPKVTISAHRYGEENPEIFAKCTARHS